MGPIPEGTQGFMKQNGNVVIAKLEDGNLKKITSNLMEYTNSSLQMILIFGLLLNYSKQILIMNKARLNVNLIYGMIKGIG